MDAIKERQLKLLYSQGKNDYEVASIMHMGRNTLRVWRKENDISSQSNKRGLTHNDAEEMYQLYQEGKTFTEIGIIYNINRTSVKRLLEKHSFSLEKSVEEYPKNRNLLEFYINYYKKRGFPYPSYNKRELKQDFNALKKISLLSKKDLLTNNRCGSKICNHYFPHRFNGKRYDSDPMSYWNNEKKFRAFIQNRLKYSERITDASIRTGMQLKGVPANFNPLIAKYIYEHYLKENGITLDFSAGYGGRLLGFLASKIDGTYIGYEPYSKSYQSLKALSEDSSELFNCKKKVKLINSPFEDSNRKHAVDLIFSSPPYFDLERYSDEETQSIIQYPEYEPWLESFWGYLVKRCYSMLSDKGFFIYSIGNFLKYDLIGDTQQVLKDSGFYLQDTIKILYHNVYKNKQRFENLYIYLK